MFLLNTMKNSEQLASKEAREQRRIQQEASIRIEHGTAIGVGGYEAQADRQYRRARN